MSETPTTTEPLSTGPCSNDVTAAAAAPTEDALLIACAQARDEAYRGALAEGRAAERARCEEILAAGAQLGCTRGAVALLKQDLPAAVAIAVLRAVAADLVKHGLPAAGVLAAKRNGAAVQHPH